MTAQLTREGTHDTTAQPTTSTGQGWFRRALHKILMAAVEFHRDARQAVEVAMPWGVDEQWHTK